MTNPDKLTETQRNEIIQNFITILAFYVRVASRREGFTLEEELTQKPDDPNIIRWQNTAQSLLDALIEVI